MTDADRAQALIDQEARIDRLANAWQAMYEQWEAGNAHSPSAHDLADEAHAQEPELFPLEEQDDLADQIYEQLIDEERLFNIASDIVKQAEVVQHLASIERLGRLP